MQNIALLVWRAIGGICPASRYKFEPCRISSCDRRPEVVRFNTKEFPVSLPQQHVEGNLLLVESPSERDRPRQIS